MSNNKRTDQKVLKKEYGRRAGPARAGSKSGTGMTRDWDRRMSETSRLDTVGAGEILVDE
jgi:hypothetical protein